ncbi:hypothetical protein [Neobacillus niacini]|uniref:hypothetical protein n=1 Tax=Neobacillus niacini TaxID=86668 RepID=UPI0021CB3EAD|nr:hypothetical protein [Neobacillus niacini]MCM3767747.1 hypothetical protein [Neobacillus niacini]
MLKAVSPLAEINWDEVEKNWIYAGESLARRGWTLPMNMTPAETVGISKIGSLEELDKAFDVYYSTGNEYEHIKKDILEHDFVKNWRELLKQCFDNYESGKYFVSIPSLFIVIENLGHMLISPRFQKYIASIKGKRRPPLRDQFTTVKQEIEQDRMYIIIYVSVVTFLNEVFKAGNFDKNETRFPIINRDWVLHGRDIPSNWNRVDALRLFHAIHTILELDFLLEESGER